jgi:hypothetical protein
MKNTPLIRLAIMFAWIPVAFLVGVIAHSQNAFVDAKLPRSGDIPELTVIVVVCRLLLSRDSGRRRRLTRFPNVARGLTFQRCVVAAFPRPSSVT